MYFCCKVVPCSLQLLAPLVHTCTLWGFLISIDGHLDTLVMLLLVCVPSEELCLQTSACAQRDGTSSQASERWVCQTLLPLWGGFSPVFVVWVLVCSYSRTGIARHPHLPQPLVPGPSGRDARARPQAKALETGVKHKPWAGSITRD